ncbi:transposable element Tcb1 transposase [Trichonephila clavipes]|uniref:Transposable element Tcb1 transposase n=1 Tax=Trichonephila clavipes TaxID=2585209 RepID=A0A8X6V9R1_TRICX|nr:transposable element Tcb1 transposase [Trichonephila clavipes]
MTSELRHPFSKFLRRINVKTEPHAITPFARESAVSPQIEDSTDEILCTTSREDRQIVRVAVTDRSVTSRTVAQHIESVTHHLVSARTIRRRLQQSGLSARRPLLGLPLTQNHRRIHRQWAWPQPYFNKIMCDHTWHALSKGSSSITRLNCFPGRPARSLDLSPIENMWSMVAQRLTQITPPAATPDQLWLRVEAAWSAVPQEHIQCLFESMPRCVAAVISNSGGYSGY